MNCIFKESLSTVVNKWDQKDLLWISCGRATVLTTACWQVTAPHTTVPNYSKPAELTAVPSVALSTALSAGSRHPPRAADPPAREQWQTFCLIYHLILNQCCNVTIPHTQRAMKSSLIAYTPTEWRQRSINCPGDTWVMNSSEVSNRWKSQQGSLLRNRNWPFATFSDK